MMLELILATLLQPDDIKKPMFLQKDTPKALPFPKMPTAMMHRLVAKAREGHEGWVKQSEILVNDDGGTFLLKSAKMSMTQTPEQHILVRCGKDGKWSMECWGFYSWEPVDSIPSGAVAVEAIYLRFRDPK